MDKKGRQTCQLAVAAALLLLAAQDTAAQGSNCRRSECVPLLECPGLLPLLQDPTSESIKQLNEATCFVRNRDPQVCCPHDGSALLPKVCGQSITFNRVIGGEEAPLDAYPWKAVLGYNDSSDNIVFSCGGSLINERYVMTAAHCVDPSLLGSLRLQFVRLGEWDLSTEKDCETTQGGDTFCTPPVQDFVPVEVLPHPAFNTRADVSDDIALIRLDRPVDFQASGYISPVCLPAAGNAPPTVAAGAIVAGWGLTDGKVKAHRIKHVRLPFVEAAQCSATYRRFKKTILDSQICMGGEAGKDSCSGDSGGPLVISGKRGPPFIQVGIVSYGPNDCGREGVPGIYTSVSHYRKWIEQNMKP